MSWRRFVPLLVSGAVLSLMTYLCVTLPKAAADECCQFPTSETEISTGLTGDQLPPYDSDKKTVALFEMTLSPDNVDFSARGDSSSGEVGEYSPDAGYDGCYAQSVNYHEQLPIAYSEDDVTTPEPTYWWTVGQVGGWDGQPGSLNTVSATTYYNTIFGYDAVGYSKYEVDTYRGFGNITFPCGYTVYQQMLNYCIFTYQWHPHVTSNWLSGNIYTAPNYIVDCKNWEPCQDINY
jgi:hypothetical protein